MAEASNLPVVAEARALATEAPATVGAIRGRSRLVRFLVGLRLLGWLAAWIGLLLAGGVAGRIAQHRPTTLAGLVHVAVRGAPPRAHRVRKLPEASNERHRAARDLVADGLVKARGEKVYRRLLAQTPDHADLNFELGELLLSSARYREAATYLERTTRVAPTNGYAFARLAEVQVRLGEVEPGLASRRKAKELGADLSRVDRDLADIYLREQHYDQAIRFFKSLDLGEEQAEVQYLLAKAFYEKGRPRYSKFRFTWDAAARIAANRHLAKALNLDPTLADALALKGKL